MVRLNVLEAPQNQKLESTVEKTLENLPKNDVKQGRQ